MIHSRLLLFLALFVLAPTGVAAQPSGLEATAGDGQVSLTWEAPNVEEGDTLACYRVYRDTTSIPDDPEGQTELRIAEVEPPEEGSPSFTDSGLSNGTTYFYRVTAETGETGEGTVSCGGSNAEESSFSEEASATPFPPTELQITDPAVPVSQPVGANAAVDVTVQGTNVPSEETVELKFRQGGDASFTTLTMVQDGTEFTASIPGAQVTARGVEFIVETRDEGGGEVRAPSDGVASVRVESEDLSFTQPGGSEQTGYRIVTYPGQLDDPQLSTLFDTLAPYDPSEWRLFAIGAEGLSADGGYVEQDNLGQEFEVGQGLWLISRSGATLGPVQGTSLRTDQPYETPLREGWNLIGNPFAFEVPVSQLRVTNSAGTLQDILGYDGTFFSEDGGVLEPYQGYLIRLSNGQSGTLVIDPTREINPSNGGDLPSAESTAPQTTWQVDVVAQIEQARDELNTFGVAPGARAGVDRADGYEPPPVGDYVSLAFQPPTQDGSLWRDLRGTDASLHTWTAEVQTNVSGMVTITTSGIPSVPPDQEVWLVDPALDVTQNLRKTSRYQFPASGEEATRRLQFLVGAPAVIQQTLRRENARPQRVELLPSVPNPIRTHATLRYQLPEPMRVTLEVYDLLGRRVTTLVDGRQVEAGTHAYSWTPGAAGEAVSSGTYLLRLRAGETTRTRRLVVVR